MNTEVMYSQEEAAVLLADVGGYDPMVEAEDLLNKASTPEEFEEFLERRINQHEPIAYITNHAKFRGLDLFVDKRVLIPRKETEAIVEVAVESLPTRSCLIDVGTGSGAVALAIKHERPDMHVMGVDISKDALDVASINSTALELDVEWHDADLIEGIRWQFDAVLANMPYLPEAKRGTYAPEMIEYEPEVALWGGADGYDLIRRLLALAAERNRVKFLALEIGLGQEIDVCELVREAGFPTVFCTKDAKEDIRAVVGKRL